jgi:hypothetical protein
MFKMGAEEQPANATAKTATLTALRKRMNPPRDELLN